MTVVVDASVALKWVLRENGSAAADDLLNEHLVAPGLWLIEAANVLWRHTVSGKLTQRLAYARFDRLRHAPVTSVASMEVLPLALELAVQLRHPVYDCLYLALAIREDTHVVTADRRFRAACTGDAELSARVELLGGV